MVGVNKDVNAFWSGYARRLSEKGVVDDHIKFYLDWAQKFARSQKGSLKTRSLTDIRGFVADLIKSGVADWRVDQAREAIAILYRDYLKMDLHSLGGCRKLADDGIRDGVRSVKAVEADYEAVFGTFRRVLAMHHYSPRTADAYLSWVRRFLVFCEFADVAAIEPSQIGVYLSYLAQERHVAESTQNQALNALVFLFKKVLKRDPGDFSGFVHAKAPVRVPDSLSLPEMAQLLASVSGVDLLITSLLYASGLRISECLSLRVQDLEFDDLNIRVYRGKGQKDRVTVMDRALVEPLKGHLVGVRKLFDGDVLHDSQLRWGDYYVFPDETLKVDENTRAVSRAHLHRNRYARALSEAAERAGIVKNVTPHVLRHTFATHMLELGNDIRKIQELLGHAFVSTTMHYTHKQERSGRVWPSLLGRFRGKAWEKS